MPRRATLAWTRLADVANGDAPRAPVSLCWSGDLLFVADRAEQEVLRFHANGAPVRDAADSIWSAARYVELAQVVCGSDGADAILGVVDQGLAQLELRRVVDGERLRLQPMLMQPQGVPLAAQLAIAIDGSMIFSWLGNGQEIGPYLSESAWDTTALAIRVAMHGGETRFGRPVAYRSRVARRVFNRTSVATSGDSVWILTHGDATIRRFHMADGQEGDPLRLAVHFRGAEPSETVRALSDTSQDFRLNTLRYTPNVGGMARLADGRFVVLRYTGWRWRLIGSGLGSLMLDATSAIDVLAPDGRQLVSYDAPGYARSIAVDPQKGRLAIISRDREGQYVVWLAAVPGATSCAVSELCSYSPTASAALPRSGALRP